MFSARTDWDRSWTGIVRRRFRYLPGFDRRSHAAPPRLSVERRTCRIFPRQPFIPRGLGNRQGRWRGPRSPLTFDTWIARNRAKEWCAGTAPAVDAVKVPGRLGDGARYGVSPDRIHVVTQHRRRGIPAGQSLEPDRDPAGPRRLGCTFVYVGRLWKAGVSTFGGLQGRRPIMDASLRSVMTVDEARYRDRSRTRVPAASVGVHPAGRPA